MQIPASSLSPGPIPLSSLLLARRRRRLPPPANPEPHQPPRRPSRITGGTNYYSHGEQWRDDSKTTLPPRNIGSLFRPRALSARGGVLACPFAFFGDKYARARDTENPRERYLFQERKRQTLSATVVFPVHG